MLSFSRKTIYNYIKKTVKKYHYLEYDETTGRLNILKPKYTDFLNMEVRNFLVKSNNILVPP
jgi:hypothetical protein